MHLLILFIFFFINLSAQPNYHVNSSARDTLYNNEISVFSDGLEARAIFTSQEELICSAIGWFIPPFPIAQKIDKTGNKLWGNQDIGIHWTIPEYPEYGIERPACILPAPDGGAYFAYDISYFGDCNKDPLLPVCTSRPFIQKVDANGNVLWGRIGIQLTSREPYTYGGSWILNMDYAPDGDVMVYYYWWSTMNYTSFDTKTYVQKVDASTGELKFGPEGKLLSLNNSSNCLISKDRNYLLYKDSVLCVDKYGNKMWSKDLLRGIDINIPCANDLGDVIFIYRKGGYVKGRLFDKNGTLIWDDLIILSNPINRYFSDCVNWGNDRWLFEIDGKIHCIDKNGAKLWGDQGVELPGLLKSDIKIAIINNTEFYSTVRVGSHWPEDSTELYLYKINENGDFLWHGNSILITEKVNNVVALFTDTEGNAYVVFESMWVTDHFWRPRGTYVQKVNKNGNIGFLTSVKLEDQSFPAPPKEVLSYAYPNPFNSSTTIWVKGVPANGNVKIKIFDILGKEVAHFQINKCVPDGIALHWDGRDRYGNIVTRGVYFYQVLSNEKIITSGKILFGGK